MQGKFSPTVTRAYRVDQNWWSKFTYGEGEISRCSTFDPDGYDSYGYDNDGKDRAGYFESNYEADDDLCMDIGPKWGFNGTKPVLSAYGQLQADNLRSNALDAAVALLKSNGYTVYSPQ